jgi:hypothetical protein
MYNGKSPTVDQLIVDIFSLPLNQAEDVLLSKFDYNHPLALAAVPDFLEQLEAYQKDPSDKPIFPESDMNTILALQKRGVTSEQAEQRFKQLQTGQITHILMSPLGSEERAKRIQEWKNLQRHGNLLSPEARGTSSGIRIPPGTTLTSAPPADGWSRRYRRY